MWGEDKWQNSEMKTCLSRILRHALICRCYFSTRIETERTKRKSLNLFEASTENECDREVKARWTASELVVVASWVRYPRSSNGFCSWPSISLLHFFTTCSQWLDLDLHRSACLTCLWCWLYFDLSKLYALIADRGILTVWTRSVILIKIIGWPIFRQIKTCSSWSTSFFFWAVSVFFSDNRW